MATFARHRVLLCRLAAALLLAPVAAAQPWQFCGQGGNYSANGTYQSNLAGLSATLPKNASASRTLFAKDSLGAVPDIVYALALCRGDVAKATACESCVATAFQDAQQLCPYDKDAFIVYDLCYLAFSNREHPRRRRRRRREPQVPDEHAERERAGGGVRRRRRHPPQRHQQLRGGELVQAVRHGGGGLRCRRRYSDHLRAVPVHAGHVAGRLPELPRAHNRADPSVPQPEEGREGYRDALQFQRWRKRSRSKQQSSYSIQMAEDIESTDSLFIDLSTLRAATGNFSESNRIGEGGFGSVYKGVLPSGEEIAVKRLSMSSGQGIEELKNELVLVAKLQQKNLVRLVGVCLQEHEKLLVYEYMPNRSIDTILFDLEKRKELDWGKRFRIINGIARALQYLHEDSQLRIIHRDLKASNVLLDSDYNPKISDFGLARLFEGDQTREVTSRVVGTYGYMAPEYAMRGHYSVKSDVFSFGILMIEIVTGRRSSGSYSFDQSYDLLSRVWEHWTMGTILEMMDPSLTSHAPRDQMLKCIHIGLLCVQDNPADRPMMSTVNIMLSSNTVSLQSPSKPSFFIPKSGTDSNIYSESYPQTSQPTHRSGMMSVNDVSVTELEPR
ncbi:hypothetical protein OsJ_24577 [Oryza sativa Japonica Group]|uniref:Uncharacterized protein n=1 Tax=Oryza sativa subsp. japonica TaxID=39947 RepID=B9FXP0_ORYSJ|nr:hypothetical protein OsJ_24577 [Oryza sativa Japonica Group]